MESLNSLAVKIKDHKQFTDELNDELFFDSPLVVMFHSKEDEEYANFIAKAGKFNNCRFFTVNTIDVAADLDRFNVIQTDYPIYKVFQK